MKKRQDNIFTAVEMANPTQSRFDLSHDVKMSFQMGRLVPTCVMEVLPGDSFNINPQNMLRFMPMVAPVMHRVKARTHFFFVPNRILWSEWEDFITGNAEVLPPFTSLGTNALEVFQVGSLADYLGIPPGDYSSNAIDVSLLPVAAYMKIYDDWYRDQNLQPNEKFVPLTAGYQSAYDTDLYNPPVRKAWEHDYFTSALPFAQKGDTVQVPLTLESDIPVDFQAGVAPGEFVNWQNGASVGNGDIDQQSGPVPYARSTYVGTNPAAYDPRGSLTVDIQADAVDINTLRRAFRLQEFLEKNARGGTRYTEHLMSHFGVRSSDARLQRSEYIGGFKHNMVFSEVLATVENEAAVAPLGTMGGHGISVGGGSLSFRAEEHGYIIGIIMVEPTTSYQDGVHRHFTRFSQLDYAFPTFANIGEQEIKLKEVQSILNIGLNPEQTWGYVPRYAEYKYIPSRVAGEMRSTLAFWQLGRIFNDPAAPPALNDQFIECDPRTDIFAVVDADEDHILAYIFNGVQCTRKLPRYGIPTI